MTSLEERLGVRFRDRSLLLAALTHPSYANEHPSDPAPTNERLEFLGDAALSLVVAETLYQRFPEVQEGRLTEWRAHVVQGPTLSRVASARVDLGPALRLGRGEEQTGGRERDGNLERAYEAIVGALFLDQGIEAVREFVSRTLGEEFDQFEGEAAVLNAKGTLQEIAQDAGLGRPDYVVVSQDGPDHSRRFTVEVRVGGAAFGQGSGGSRQEAEKQAAMAALPALQQRLRRQTGTSTSDAGAPGAGIGA
ncbi:MAG: ribonuclease III [Dehalococcoidia bacterium]|nr:MAG: ribonuclease III [Dehalococcoidia bacterium]